jgi:hypothetical protein
MNKANINGRGQEYPPHTNSYPSLILPFAKQHKGRPFRAALVADCKSGLRRLYILCLPALGALHHIELNLLTFLQTLESTGLDG